MRPGATPRYCARCGARLASDNTATACRPCQRTAREAGERPPEVPREFWDDPQLRDALIRERHIGHAVRSYREHPFHGQRPISQSLAAKWLNISQTQLSRIEKGRPLHDLDRLIQWAKTLRIPTEMLWFSLPDSEAKYLASTAVSPSNSIITLDNPTDAPRSESQVTTDPLHESFAADTVEDVKRREFLIGAATAAGFSAIGAITAREAIRLEIGSSLIGRSSVTDVDEWREICAEYGESYPATEPTELLKSLMVDMYSLKAAMQAIPGESRQRALRGVGAMLSAFTAQTIANLGNLSEARRWWRTARNGADESEDPFTVLWIRGREIVRAGYEQRPVSAILQLIDELEARITGSSPITAMPQFLAGKAQALALMGGPAANEAENTLSRLKDSFDALPLPARTGHDSIFSWGEERLRFTESLTYTLEITVPRKRLKQRPLRSTRRTTCVAPHKLNCNAPCASSARAIRSRVLATHRK